MKRYVCDVLVIGSGGAGLIAACEAAKAHVRVAVVNKGYAQHTGATIMAPGAIAAVGEAWKSPGDSREIHFKDTIEGGQYLNNQDLVHRMIYEAADVVKEMENLGAVFERREDGESYSLRTDGGHTYPRSLYMEDRIGRELVRVLMGEITRCRVPIYENIMVTRIIRSGGVVSGAAGILIQTQEPVLFECSAVILATGGVGFAYENSDDPVDLTGDGLALALECGVNLMDMEFVQFYPLGFLWPPALKGLFGAYINHIRLFNAQGRRFMADYNEERMELTTRDILSSAMMREVLEGRGSPRGGVYADFKHLAPEVMEKDMPGMCATYRNIGFDSRTQSLEIAPTAHFTMGGLEVDKNWATSLPGLFGAGEVCGGIHGANRVSQNALTDMLVSGKAAGRSAAQHAMKRQVSYKLSPTELNLERERINKLYTAEDGMEVSTYRDVIRKTLWEKAGVLREQTGMEEAVKVLEELEHTPQKLCNHNKGYNKEVICALENQNMVTAALTIVYSALVRKETRGAHIRTDYPNTDDNNFLKNVYIHKENGTYQTTLKDVELKYCRREKV